VAKARDTDEGLRRRLDAARNNFELLRIVRTVSDDKLEAYVLDIGAAWVLVALLDGESVRLESFTALRLHDIDEVETAGGDRFVRRALELQGQWPPEGPPVAIALDDAAAIVRSGAGICPLVTIHPELDDPDICFIGVAHGSADGMLELLEIDTQAEWEAERQRHPLKDVTRIDFGGRYEEWLYRVGGPPPDLPAR
jgi:hypothetical protein